MNFSEASMSKPARLPWATEWLASWSSRPSPKMRQGQGFAWQSAPDGEAMSLALSAETETVMIGYASSLSCGVFIAGELHNRDELCANLSLPQDSRDAELVLSAWQVWGTHAFDRIEGVFAIIVRDMRDGRLWAARDPMGCHPFFFAQTGHGLLLSDSVTMLLRHPSVSRDVNRRKLAEWSFGNYGEPHETFYEAAYRVPPGHYLCATRHNWELQQYWFLPEVRPPEQYSLEEARTDFLREFAHAVARRYRNGQTSIFLSGGLDSISVASQSADISRTQGMVPPIALSLFFPHPDCDERLTQEAVARALGLRQFSMSFDEAFGPSGMVLSGLELSSKLSAPLLNSWRPGYVSLMQAAKKLGSIVTLTGIGGDEWLGVSPFYMADLIKRGEFSSAARMLRDQLRSFQAPLHKALRFQLWTAGLRPLIIRGLRPIVIRMAPFAARAIWRRREQIPAWVAPDPELRGDLLLRRENAVERQFSTRFSRGRHAFYISNAEEIYMHPLSAGDREEDFEVGKLVGQRLDHPYWDTRLIRRLHEIPPEWLSHNGYSKGLVREPIATRFPALGLEKKKKVMSMRFFVELMMKGLPPAWEFVGGLKALSELGAVDPQILDSEVSGMVSSGDGFRLNRVLYLLNMESWARERVSGTTGH